MWSRLPGWIWVCALLLAFLAGMVNTVGLLGFQHQGLTHMTGLTSRLAQGIAEGDGGAIIAIASIMFSFVGGAILSGLLIQDSALRWGRQYGVALALESAFLALSPVLTMWKPVVGLCVASLACGLQNAMASNFSGSAIRTTHVSGMVTDLGTFIGHWIRGMKVDGIRLRICISTVVGFLTGGICSTLLFKRLGTATLYIPAALALVLALTYQTMRGRQAVTSHRSDITE